MQLSDAAIKLRKMCGNPSVADVPEANLFEHLDAAHKELLDKWGFHKARQRKTFSTIVGTNKYQIEPMTSTVYKVWDRTNKKRLLKGDRRYIAETDFDGALPGKPEKYTRFSDYMQISPVPDGVYVIEFMYEVNPVPMVNSGDTFLNPPSWDRGVLLLARYYYYSDEARDAQKASYHLQEFNAWLKDKPIELHEEQAADMDSGVDLPTLSGSRSRERLDFDHDS